MEITQISKLVIKIACDHDRISFAGRGCFLTQMMPASISERGTVINPPYKRLYYRSNEVSDDTLLADAYAAEAGISRSRAEEEVKSFADNFCEELDRTKTLIIPGLGKMRATAQNEYFFIADPGLDIFPDGRGLVPVNMKILRQEEVSMPSDAETPSAAQAEEAPTVKKQTLKETLLEPFKEILDDEAPEEKPEEPASEPEPAPAPASEPAPEPEPAPAPVPAEEDEAESESRKGISAAGIVLIVLGCIVLLAVAAFAVLYACRNQAWVDSLLYSKEDLEFLKHLTL